MPIYETVMHDKPSIVLDIGYAYTKLGLATEAYPRKITPSEAIISSDSKTKNIFDYSSEIELRDNLIAFFHIMFFKHLSVTPKERKIILIESLFGETIIREAIAYVLFRHFDVSSVLFFPSHSSALSTLALDSGIVIDIGYREATVLPIFSGVNILQAFQDQPFGAKMIHEEIKRQLVETGVQDDYLTESVLEDIKIRTCFVTSLERANMYRKGEKPTPPPDVDYQILDKQIITIPGIVRETAFEVMFVEDNENSSLPHLVLNAILKCSFDIRKILAENILVVGGSAIILGLLPRLKSELNAIAKSSVYQNKLFIENFKFHKTIGRQNFTAWLGGSFCGGTELLNQRSLTKEAYMKNGRVPDWINLKDNRGPGVN